jgi:hypothetical protein
LTQLNIEIFATVPPDVFTHVLERNTTGHYAVCGHTWHSLQLVDYALLSLLRPGAIDFFLIFSDYLH